MITTNGHNGSGWLFQPGRILATPGAKEELDKHPFLTHQLLLRHLHGDWGDCCPEDAAANEMAIEIEARIFSVYHLPEEY